MNKQEALEKLAQLQKTVSCADDIDSVGWNHDIEPVERLAKELGIYYGEVKKIARKIYDDLVFNYRGRRNGINWSQVFDLFNATQKAIEAMP